MSSPRVVRYDRSVATAIVTITCPKCGGEVKGIRATDVAQTVPCTFCGAELHVPHVGDDIVRERVVQEHVVREVVVEPAAMVLRRRPLQPWQIALSCGVLAAGIVVFVAIPYSSGDHHADDVLHRIDQEEHTRQACETGCKAQCKDASRPHPTTGDPELDRESEDVLRKTDVVLCESECETKQNCFAVSRSAP